MRTKILIRTFIFNSRYQQWIGNSKNLHIEMLRGSYANEVFGLGAADLMYEYSPAYSCITWSPVELEIEDLDFMLEYFKEIMLKNNYDLTLSDERNEIFDNGIKLTIHRHYLKSGSDSGDSPDVETSDQFGNICIEHRFNSFHNTLIISAHSNQAKRFQSFEKLMELLLG